MCSSDLFYKEWSEIKAEIAGLIEWLANKGMIKMAMSKVLESRDSETFRENLIEPLQMAERFIDHYLSDRFKDYTQDATIIRFNWKDKSQIKDGGFLFLRTVDTASLSGLTDFITQDVIIDPVKIKCGGSERHDEIIDRRTFHNLNKGHNARCCLCRAYNPVAVPQKAMKGNIREFLTRYLLFREASDVLEMNGKQKQNDQLTAFILEPVLDLF